MVQPSRRENYERDRSLMGDAHQNAMPVYLRNCRSWGRLGSEPQVGPYLERRDGLDVVVMNTLCRRRHHREYPTMLSLSMLRPSILSCSDVCGGEEKRRYILPRNPLVHLMC
jgi:hypothetical protein